MARAPGQERFIQPIRLSLTVIWIIDHGPTFETPYLACTFATSGQNIINQTLMHARRVEGGLSSRAFFFLGILNGVGRHGHPNIQKHCRVSREEDTLRFPISDL
ncbi:MAG: hypothetical protein A4E19_04725 [Nitrospira sp. SG-bin1]|nr:MAG: hypothetical protein A4E19_04725 [Nitrospira sp. SG-bin1]